MLLKKTRTGRILDYIHNRYEFLYVCVEIAMYLTMQFDCTNFTWECVLSLWNRHITGSKSMKWSCCTQVKGIYCGKDQVFGPGSVIR